MTDNVHNTKGLVPTWYWHECGITDEELKNVQQEVLASMPNILPNYKEKGQFTSLAKDSTHNASPALVAYLKRIGLYDRWQSVIYIVVNSTEQDAWPIHIDEENRHRRIALNIPITNCEGSYTAWYETKAPNYNPEADPRTLSGNKRKVPVYYDTGTATEVYRKEASVPFFINAAVPHRPVPGELTPRVMLSLRFWPEIFDHFGIDIINDVKDLSGFETKPHQPVYTRFANGS